MAHTPTYWRARFMIAGSVTLPVDVEMRLRAEGYDPDELVRLYG